MRFTIDEELWFQSDRDAGGEKAAAESLAARGARIVGAKAFPVAAQRLERLTRNPECPIHEIVKVLETDPALSAHLLRLVNSAGFGLKVRCTAVRHAAALVGLEKLHQLATTAAVLDLFDSGGEEASGLIEHANVVAALSRYLAGHLALDGDDLFTCGFLHDIGKLMLLETEGEEYAALLHANAGQGDVMHLVERERFGFDHAMLGGHVLRAWRIPEPVPKVVAWHHRVGLAYEAGSSVAMLVNTVRLADALSYALEQRDTRREVERLSRSDAASYLDISEQQLAAMWDDLALLVARSRATFRGEAPPASLPRPVGPRASVRPSLGSVVAGDAAPPTAPEFDGPRQFPCVVCRKPTFGNACPACRGQVCPEHEVGPERWCRLCADDFAEARRADGIPPTTRVALVAGLATLAAGSAALAHGLPGEGVAKLVGAPLVVVTLTLGLFLVGRRAALRVRFLWSRPRRDQPAVDSPFGSSFPTPSIRYGVVANPEERDGPGEAPIIELGRIVPLSSIPPAVGEAPAPRLGSNLPPPADRAVTLFPSRVPTERPPPPGGEQAASATVLPSPLPAEPRDPPTTAATEPPPASGEAVPPPDEDRPSAATLDRAALAFPSVADEAPAAAKLREDDVGPVSGDETPLDETSAPTALRVAVTPAYSCVPRTSRPATIPRSADVCSNVGSHHVSSESATFRVVGQGVAVAS